MAEEKKPKIDLKARLGKKDAGATPAPPGVAVPDAGVAPPPAAASAPAVTPGLPVPPGIPVGPAPTLDPSNPLVAAMAPKPAPAAPAPPPAPTRIEVDEMAVQEAAKKARNRGFVVAAIAAVLFAGVGFVGGQASQQGSDRTRGHDDAQDLKKNVEAAKAQLDQMAQKVEAGKNLLVPKDPATPAKYPDTLDDELGGIVVDFDGSKLAGRRFSGMPTDVAKMLFDFVARVAALNDHKTALKNLLTKLEKPMKEQLAASTSGTHAIQHIVLLGGPLGKDPGGNYFGMLGTLTPPLSFTGDSPTIKDDFKANVPKSGGGGVVAVTAKGYKSGDLAQATAVYLAPQSFEAACPSETRSQAAQLGFKLSDILTEIRGEGPAPEGAIVDQKPGLLETADLLIKGLEKI